MKFNLFNREKKIPTKNYVIVAVVSITIIIVLLVARSMYLNYRYISVKTGAFYNSGISELNSDGINYALSETNEAVLYVSFTGNREVYNMEKRLIKEINKMKLNDKVIYWNIKDYSGNEAVEILRKQFPEISDQINALPLLIYIKDGKGKEAMSSELRMIDYKVFIKLVAKYGIE